MGHPITPRRCRPSVRFLRRSGASPWRPRLESLEERCLLDSAAPSLVVGRTLSSYFAASVANGQETITYTVYNEQVDPETGVALTTTLAPGVTLVSASPAPVQSGQQLSWNLGTLNEFTFASVQVTVALISPAAGPIDGGASASATLDGNAISAANVPAVLSAGTVDQSLLASTPDASTTDPYVQQKAAELAYDPQQIFHFLQSQIGYESYVGSLLGARGTLWSGAGNSLDVASLGIALLRASGIPAQYASGTLATNEAQQLIASMFASPLRIVGCLPSGAALSFPAQNGQYLSETEAHDWIEYNTGQGFVDADPLIPGAQIGQTFTTATQTFAEVPAALRATTTVALTAEITNTADALFGLPGQQDTTVLTQTYNDVDLVGRTLTLGQTVSSAGIGALFSAVTNSYTPFIVVHDEATHTSQDLLTVGQEFQETLTNFPFGTQALTGLFLNVTTSAPETFGGSTSSTVTKTLFDRLGYAARTQGGGGSFNIDPDAAPALNDQDIVTLNISAAAQLEQPLLAAQDELNSDSATLENLLPEDPSTPDPSAQPAVGLGYQVARETTSLAAGVFADTADQYLKVLDGNLLATSYFVTPRIVAVQATNQADPTGQQVTTSFAVDILQDQPRSIPAPGQNAEDSSALLFLDGLADSNIEEDVFNTLAPSGGMQSTGAIDVFLQALGKPGASLLKITSASTDQLDGLPISDEAKERIIASVNDGQTVYVPTTTVSLDGQPRTAWVQVDPATGSSVAVLDDGTHDEIESEVVRVPGPSITNQQAQQLIQLRNLLSQAKGLGGKRVLPQIRMLLEQLKGRDAIAAKVMQGFLVTTEQLLSFASNVAAGNSGVDPPEGDILYSPPTPSPGFAGLGAGGGTTVAAAIIPDPVFTVPDAGAQLPTAFRVGINNPSSTSQTFTLQVTGLPGSISSMTSVPQITVPAGATAEVGVCVTPQAGVPIQGTTINFGVKVTSTTDATNSVTASESFTIPEIDQVTLTASPAMLNTSPGVAATTTLTLDNVGNTTENITLGATLPAGVTATGLGDLSLAPGAKMTETVTLTPAGTVPLNSALTVAINASFGPSGADVQSANVVVHVISPGAATVAAASVAAGQLNNSGLVGRLGDLGNALTNLGANPTDRVALGQVQANLTSLISQFAADPYLSGFTAGLSAAQTALGAATTASAVQGAIADLGTALDALAGDISDEAEHGFTLALSPSVVIVQPGAPSVFDLVMTNNGSGATTYHLSIAGLPAGVTALFSEPSVTLEPGASIGTGNNPITLTLTEPGTTLVATGFNVIATAEGAPEITRSTPGQLTLRNESILVVGAITNPLFTTAGGQVAVSAEIAAAVNKPTQVMAMYTVADSTRRVVFVSSPVAVHLGVTSALTNSPLGTLDTTGFASGTDTVTVSLLDASGQPIPGAAAVGTLVIGAPVTGTLTTSPALVPTGSATVSTTVQISTATVYPAPLILQGAVSTPAPGTSVALYQASGKTYAYESGTGGIDAIDVTDPTQPVFLTAFGMNDITNGQFGFNVAKVVGNELLVGTSNGNNGSVFNLLVYSLATPGSPTLVSNTTINYRFLSDMLVNSTGSAVYVPTNGFLYSFGSIFQKFGDLVAIDLTDPTMPALASALFTNEGQPDGGDMSEFGGTLVNDSTAYITGLTPGGGNVTSNTGNLLVVNVADPRNMSVVKSLTIPGTINLLNVAVQGNRALVIGTAGTESTSVDFSAKGVANNLALTVLDISNPLNPQILGSTLVTTEQFPINEAGAKTDVVSLGNGDFAVSDVDTGGNPSLLVVDPSDPSHIVVSSAQVPSGVHGITVQGSTVYATTSTGLTIYQAQPLVSDPLTLTVNLPAGGAANIVPGSFSVAPDQITTSPTVDKLIWNRSLAAGNSSYTFAWQTAVTNIQAGQRLPVTLGATAVSATLGTPVTINLPGTGVTGTPIVAINPGSATAAPGGTASYVVRLTNPTSAAVTYFESVMDTSGPLPGSANLPLTVTVPANSSVDEPLVITTYAFAQPGSSGFSVSVNTGQNGASGSAQATLVVAGTPVAEPNTTAFGVVVGLNPGAVTAAQASSAVVNVQVINTGSSQDTFTLDTTDLPAGISGSFSESSVELPPVAAGFQTVTLTFNVPQGTTPGVYPFQVVATSTGASSVSSTASGTLTVVADGVKLALSPASTTPGSGLQLNVTNTGTVRDTFDLTLTGPAAAVASLGQNQVTLDAGTSQVVPITTGAVNFAFPGDLGLTVYASLASNPAIRSAASAALTIPLSTGVSAAFSPSAKILPVPGSASFLLMVTNTGNSDDAYTATITATNGPVTAALADTNGQPVQTLPAFLVPGLGTASILLQANITAMGSGTITVMIKSVTNSSETATATATISASAASPTPTPIPTPAPTPTPTPPTATPTVVVSGDGPRIVAVHRFGFHRQPTSLVLSFNEALDPGRAENPHNYLILNRGGRGRRGHDLTEAIRVRRVIYDPVAHTVTLAPSTRLDVHNRYELIVAGSAPGGLADSSGRLMDGASSGVPGSDFRTVISLKALAGPAPLVRLKP